ncbi:DUF3536 domain-containing protein [Methanospirillum stamsii]|uniref:Glycoside hydrolase n=1 Tax=Methanospirillum stamsii TaxID=1277351 RepID=A0A2V2N9I1_9EURY|nr:DUF3536 domain-containing protein [Methanospirillum stamsii]PWR75235.1 glycoside hydrolase [Methanospirillum stamsii]
MIISKYICVHGHFYQPPRENPWLEEIEIEESAYPFHDWNERVTAECYAPNASSRILGSDKKIINIVNNYAKISFNFGPTLLSWLEQHNKDVYRAILNADKESQNNFSGHGSAIAQAYNHIILPLASYNDKKTEILWGIKDFIYRFERMPEGMWLPETAVDIESLEILAELGIKFTILAPHQAKRIRKISQETWLNITQDTLDIFRPYLCILPSSKKISIFFYDSGIANEVAFQNILENGDLFADRLIRRFPDSHESSELLSIANDGETYGHHHRFADMALAYALKKIELERVASITIYGEYLDKFPPEYEVSIAENTSWSCIHGVKRWEDDCGCRAMYACLITDTSVCYPIALQDKNSLKNIKPWNQQWRKPLRDAMNWLHSQLNQLYEKEMESLFQYPFTVRDDYIDILIDRSPEKIIRFFNSHAKRNLSHDEIVRSIKLLEIQKNLLFMQTSCGWFFDDLAGIETVQVMMYACRAMHLLRDIIGIDLEPEYVTLLTKAKSNVLEIGDGGTIYNNYVKSAIFDINRVAFQYAVTSLIKNQPDESAVPTYDIFNKSFQEGNAGRIKLATGYALFRSKITLKESTLIFVALHLGEHNFIGGIKPFTTEEAFNEINNDIWTSLQRNDLPRLILGIDRNFDYHSFSLWHLFRDGKRKVLYSILNEALSDINYEYQLLYKRYYSLVTAMKELHIKPPTSLEFPIQFSLNNELKICLSKMDYDETRLSQIITDLTKGKFQPEIKTLSIFIEELFTRFLEEVEKNPFDINNIQKTNRLFTIISPLSLSLDLRNSQNSYFRLRKMIYERMKTDEEAQDESAKEWLEQFIILGDNLDILSI